MSPKFAKMTKIVLVLIPTKLYNKCLKEHGFLGSFKLSLVTPIPKTAEPNEFSDFRYIFSKYLKKYWKIKWFYFISKSNLLTYEQFAFRQIVPLNMLKYL